MQSFLKWLDRAPLFLLIALAVWMAGAPFTPEPHLVEKLRINQEPERVLEWVRGLNGPGALPDDFSLLTVEF